MATKSRLLTILLVLLHFIAKAQPHAEFSAIPQSGCAPLVVNFSDSSSGNPTQWRWDLGNGTISFLQNPSVTYLNPGNYDVKLVVHNGLGKDSIIKTRYITIYEQPVANFGASVKAGCSPLGVQFTDSSIAGSGVVNSWLWDFGDGNSSTEKDPTHVYTASGVYNVSLRVGTDVGCYISITRQHYILIYEGVEANFSNTIPNTCTPPLNITFQNQSIGTGGLVFAWDFGDGNTSTDINPLHTYNSNGSYTVKLIVTNSNGCSDTLIRPNAISIGAVRADFNPPANICLNTPVTFTNTSSPPPVSATWDFGNGIFISAINPVTTFNTAGIHFVKLISNFGACTDSVVMSVTVLPKPTAGFSSIDTSSCKAPYTTTFLNESLDASSYHWYFGDGDSSTAVHPSHTYTTAGIYTITLVAINSNGCTDTMVRQQYVKIVLPVVTIDNLPQQGCEPFTWGFSSTVISSEPITGYFWDFGDGNTSTDPTPTHTFDSGRYTIKLIVVTASGCTDTTRVLNGIRVGRFPHANFAAAPLDVCANMPISFFDSSTGTINRWAWSFGDDGSSALQNPIHVYTDTGFFNVMLIVYNNGCTDTLVIDSMVHINPPIAKYSVSFNCRDKFKRTFRDRSIGADDWFWDFGDGTTSISQNAVHIYSSPGVYSTSLTVRNFRTGCEYTETRDVTVLDEQADFMSLDTASCKNSLVTFTAINSDPSNVNTYTWAFGDGGTATGQSVTYSYAQAGNYNVTLILNDRLGCKDTLTRSQFIIVNGPTANFSASTPGNCLLSPIAFIDSSFASNSDVITSWTWNFGDGISQTDFTGPFSHSYTSAGIYSVSLTVLDNTGCSDTKILNSLITISKPLAGFASIDTITCPNRPVLFTNNSTGPGLLYSWDFGDGTTDIGITPSHNYAADGVYTIKLVIHDQYGCADSMIRPSYIKILTPQASFNVSDSVGNCPPLVVQFTSTSQNALSINWDFGDGTSSQLTNPSHFYALPGAYVARLTVTGIGGCTTFYERNIRVDGPFGTFAYTPIVGCRPLLANFTASTINRDIIVWDFNDGTTLITTDSVVSHVYTTPGIYIPKMILRNNAGCHVAINGTDTIVVNGVEPEFDFNTSTYCDNGSVHFNNTSGSHDIITGYTWHFGDGDTSTQQSPTHYYDTTGLYYPSLTIITEAGCRDSLASLVPVKIVKKPDAVLLRSGNGCVPLTVTFRGSLNNPDTSQVSWLWDFGNGQTSQVTNPPSQIFDPAGDYTTTLLVENSSGCKDTVLSIVSSYPIPVVNAGLDTLNCFRKGVNLHATGGDTYTWSPANSLNCFMCADPIANPDTLTTYTVTGTSIHGCSQTDKVSVRLQYPFKLVYSKPDTLCDGTSLQMFATGAYSYNWTPSVTPLYSNAAIVNAVPHTTTTYRVIGTDINQCFNDTGYIPIKVYPIPTVEAGSDITINAGKTVDLVPVISPDVTKVTWQPTGSIFRNTFPAITVKPKETTVYYVEASNDGGCSAVDNLTVYVICNGANVFIPNTFSPNDDGVNDIFYPRGTGLFTIKSARIFNRWGEMVYEKTNFTPNVASVGWDGSHKGMKLTPDVFVYLIEIVCENNTTLTYKGNITLVK